MAQRQVVLTGSTEQLKQVVEFVNLINRNLKIGQKKVDLHFVTAEELESRVRDAINSFHIRNALTNKRNQQ